MTELRHPPHIAAATCHRACKPKWAAVIAAFSVMYLLSALFSYQTMGQPRDWALSEQKRIVRKRAKDAKEKGIMMGGGGEDANKKKSLKDKEGLQIDEEELPSPYLPNAWVCLFVFFTVFFVMCRPPGRE